MQNLIAYASHYKSVFCFVLQQLDIIQLFAYLLVSPYLLLLSI